MVSQQLNRVQATAGGQPMAVEGRGEISAPVGDGPSAISLSHSARHALFPPHNVAAVDVLSGQLKVLFPADVEAFRFQSLSANAVRGHKPQQHIKVPVTVTLDSLHKTRIRRLGA